MRRKSKVIVFSSMVYSILCLGLIAAELDKEKSGDAEENLTVMIGDKKLPLNFKQKDISEELKRTIAKDLELNFPFMDNLEFTSLPNGAKDSQNQTDNQTITHRLNYVKEKPLLPEVIQRHFGEAVKTQDNYILVIDTKLIEAYKKALKRIKENQEMFNKLEEFMDLLQNREKLRQIAQDPRRAKRKTYFYRMEPPKDSNAYMQLLEYAKVNIRKPSLLDIRPFRSMMQDDSLSSDLFGVISVLSYEQNNEEIRTRWPLGVFEKDTWHFLIMESP